MKRRNDIIHGTFTVDSDAFLVGPPQPAPPDVLDEALAALRKATAGATIALEVALEHRARFDPLRIPEVLQAWMKAVGLDGA